MQMLIICYKSTLWIPQQDMMPSDDFIINNTRDNRFLKILFVVWFFCLTDVANFLPSEAILRNVL